MVRIENNFFARKEGLITLHVLFWVCYLCFHLLELMVFQPEQGIANIFGRLFISIWVDVAAAYFTVYFLIFNLIFRKKYLLFSVLLLLSATFFVFLQRIVLYYISYPVFYPGYFENKGFWDFYPLYSFFNIYAGTAIFTSLVFLRQLFISQRKRIELESQNKSSELALLRSQISPHFLFNTLNNIDSLIFLNQELASASVIKLSEILRYMLYEASTDRVPVNTEISYLKSYIRLQELRTDQKDFTKFQIKGSFSDLEIAPMLLIPFVENAFKHGSKNVTAPGVEILAERNGHEFHFRISNFMNQNKDANKDGTPGIGLMNVRRRLQLIYPNEHNLEIRTEHNIYIVDLKIYYS
jgi:sensor histidine kinase YesM